MTEQHVDEPTTQEPDEDTLEKEPVETPVGEDVSEDVSEDNSEDGDEGDGRPSRRERLESEGEIAADYLEELLEIADLDGDLDMDVEGDRATVSIVGADLPQLIGDDGEVLEALQELTRLAVYRQTGERSRLMLDVSGHRAGRRVALEQLAAGIVEQVRSSGERADLEPMSPFERKVVHDVVAAAGLVSESEGTEPRRHVVVLPG
jgi:spoIIIJ-associated protein